MFTHFCFPWRTHTCMCHFGPSDIIATCSRFSPTLSSFFGPPVLLVGRRLRVALSDIRVGTHSLLTARFAYMNLDGSHLRIFSHVKHGATEMMLLGASLWCFSRFSSKKITRGKRLWSALRRPQTHRQCQKVVVGGCGGWWLWWLVVGGWWLVVGGWWLVVGG